MIFLIPTLYPHHTLTLVLILSLPQIKRHSFNSRYSRMHYQMMLSVFRRFSRSLLYTDQYSSQCDTQGRVCLHRSHCAELCCGRGFNTRSKLVSLYCHCGWDRPLKLRCGVCHMHKLTFICK